MAVKDYQDFRAMITVLVKICSVKSNSFTVIMKYNSVTFYSREITNKPFCVFRLTH